MGNNTAPHTMRLADLSTIFQFEQLIKESTRVTAASRTLIDLAFCYKSELITMSGVQYLGISDHSLIFVCRKLSVQGKEPKIIKSRQYKRYNKISFLADLKNILQFSSNDENPDIVWEDFKMRFLSVADAHAPEITRKVKNSRWMTYNIKRMIYHRDFLKKNVVKTGSENMFIAYKKARNQLNNLIQDTKRKYYTSVINNIINNPKDIWKTINKLTNKRSKTITITKLNILENNFTENPNQISNTLNTYFNTVGIN